MKKAIVSIPQPLVRTNQWFIFISVIFTWVTGQGLPLLLPLIAGIMGLIWNFNPIMRFARLFLRKPAAAYIPEDWEQQQFNQLIAVTCLSLGFIGYVMNWMILAYIATSLVAAASFIAILGFCIGCFIRYQWIKYRHKKSLN
ncbi:DUF4395 domain-containing protein [Ectobacillus antri]|jgi:hypothetical protein|uniref:DUF4395 domain-containing protein n=1 Tax=Ectobacillus antri TaxID=2486280 RepID=A0ABT6H6U5_9BACI|nr:DUF4395 domain-containing protein [Ectobacillus antri]MDG4657079.1 DUF4395 domain-containing protein [Ectobacillus antri]MDG5754181.1 DUF4395 domain-containing protein [Ectobacillus antri]